MSLDVRASRPSLPALLALALLLSACSTAPKSAADRKELERDARGALASMKVADTTLEPALDKSYAHAIFPSVGKGAVGVGGAYGRGILYEQGKMAGYCDLSQGTIGLQLGGQSYRELILFEDVDACRNFKLGKLNFAAQASAVAIESGASADAEYDRGVLVFTMARGGLMAEASIGGQRFTYSPVR